MYDGLLSTAMKSQVALSAYSVTFARSNIYEDSLRLIPADKSYFKSCITIMLFIMLHFEQQSSFLEMSCSLNLAYVLCCLPL